jgi:hypothetical protein
MFPTFVSSQEKRMQLFCLMVAAVFVGNLLSYTFAGVTLIGMFKLQRLGKPDVKMEVP